VNPLRQTGDYVIVPVWVWCVCESPLVSEAKVVPVDRASRRDGFAGNLLSSQVRRSLLWRNDRRASNRRRLATLESAEVVQTCAT